jgi:hypothetical protein
MHPAPADGSAGELMKEQMIRTNLQPGKTARVLGAVLLFLIAGHIAGLLIKYLLGHNNLHGLIPLFNLNSEANIPTFFSSLTLLSNAFLFLCVWKALVINNRRQTAWLLLSCIFVFLAVDENCSIHELLVVPVRNALHTSGYFYFAWYIPYGIAVLVLAIYMLPVLWRLTGRIRLLLVLSGIIYLSGAVGVEMISGKYLEYLHTLGQRANAAYEILNMLEETLEMTGSILCIYSLLSLLQSECGGIMIRFSGTQGPSPDK